MNSKGQAVFYLLMLSIVCVILALALAPVLKQYNDDARAPSSDTRVGLDCSNASISDYDKANCVSTDINYSAFFWIILAIGGAVAAAKFIP